MDIKEIEAKLLPIITEYLPDEVSKEDVTPEKDLLKDLQINSAYIIDIVIAIEEEFDIVIEDDAIAEMNTVQESIDMIIEKIKQNG
ncbi:MAG: acyl carrier protein [Cyclobacteriaceae bacterium]